MSDEEVSTPEQLAECAHIASEALECAAERLFGNHQEIRHERIERARVLTANKHASAGFNPKPN
jgi:hypothetical protein